MADMIIGVDEAGRGPLAGPVVAAAVLLGEDDIAGLDDSKKLSPIRRAALEGEIKARCRWAIGEASVAEIDAINILEATMLAMVRAVEGLMDSLGHGPAEILVDGNRLPEWRWRSRAIVGGDGRESAISAASIIAKQHRDRMMVLADAEWPAYAFASHKGYGTPAHLAALRRHGPCPIHRTSFAPVSQLSLAI